MDWTWWWWWRWWHWWSWCGPRSARRAASCSWDRALRSPGREWPAPTSWRLGLRLSIISQSSFWSQVEREIYLKSRLADQPPCALSPSSPWSVLVTFPSKQSLSFILELCATSIRKHKIYTFWKKTPPHVVGWIENISKLCQDLIMRQPQGPNCDVQRRVSEKTRIREQQGKDEAVTVL